MHIKEIISSKKRLALVLAICFIPILFFAVFQYYSYWKSKTEREEDQAVYQKAIKQVNIEALRQYLKDFPKGQYVFDAQKLLDTHKRLANSKHVTDLESFINEHPNSEFITFAKNRIAQLDNEFFTQASKKHNRAKQPYLPPEDNKIGPVKEEVLVFQEYLKQFPQGKHLSEVQKRLSDLEQEIDEMGTVQKSSAILKEFLLLFPKSKNTEKAKDFLEFLRLMEKVPKDISLSDKVVYLQNLLKNTPMNNRTKRNLVNEIKETLVSDCENTDKKFIKRVCKKPNKMDAQIIAYILDQFYSLRKIPPNLGNSGVQYYIRSRNTASRFVSKLIPKLLKRQRNMFLAAHSIPHPEDRPKKHLAPIPLPYITRFNKFVYRHGRIPIRMTGRNHYPVEIAGKDNRISSLVPKFALDICYESVHKAGGRQVITRNVSRTNIGNNQYEIKTETTYDPGSTPFTEQANFTGQIFYIHQGKSYPISHVYTSKDPHISVMRKKGFKRKNHIKYILSNLIKEMKKQKIKAIKTKFAPLVCPREFKKRWRFAEFLEATRALFIGSSDGFDSFVEKYPDCPFLKDFIDVKWNWNQINKWALAGERK